MAVPRQAGIYARISSDPEGRQVGVERQQKDARALAKRLGWYVVDTYVDPDITGTGKRSRPQWERLLKDVETGRVDAIAAYSSSRMYRNLRDLTRLIDLADKGRVQIETCVSGQVDVSTADGRMVARILASVDAAEAERTGERVKRAFAEHGKKPGGSRRAFGYDAAGKDPDGKSLGYVINKDEAARIKDAVRRIIAGKTTCYRVAMDWNSEGVRTPYGGRWRPSRVKRTLTGEHLTGKGRPAIITEDERRLLLAALGEREAPRGRGRPSGRRYAALRLLVCGTCGEQLHGRSGQYICPDGHMSIKATPTEQWLAGHTADHLPKRRPRKPKPTKDVEPILRDLRAVEERYSEVEAAIENREMPVKAGGRLLVKMDAQREDLQRRLGRNLPGQSPDIKNPFDQFLNPGDYWDRWSRRELSDAEVALLQDFLRAFVTEVKVSPAPNGGRGRQRFSPDRLTVHWR